MEHKSEEAESPEELTEEGGGPVKSFLEHLEDLRWMLIKSGLAILISMVVCLIAGNRLVAILAWPLNHAPAFGSFGLSASTQIPVFLGTNVLGRVPADMPGLAVAGTNGPKFSALLLTPVAIGTNIFLAAQLDTNAHASQLQNGVVLKNYTPLGGIMVALKLAIYGGLILASPFLLYFIGQFVLPALKVKEKSLLFRVVAFGSVLFFCSVGFLISLDILFFLINFIEISVLSLCKIELKLLIDSFILVTTK